MLKKYKNELINLIQKFNLNMNQFVLLEEENGVVKIEHQNSNLWFEFISHKDTYDVMGFGYSTFSPSRELVHQYKSRYTFDQLFEIFEGWIQTEVMAYIEEASVPDSWEELRNRSDINPSFEEDLDNFSEDEIVRIKLSISNFKVLIQEKYSPSLEEMEFINSRLDYVENEVKKLNKFNWKSVFQNILISIGKLIVKDNNIEEYFEIIKNTFSIIGAYFKPI